MICYHYTGGPGATRKLARGFIRAYREFPTALQFYPPVIWFSKNPQFEASASGLKKGLEQFVVGRYVRNLEPMDARWDARWPDGKGKAYWDSIYSFVVGMPANGIATSHGEKMSVLNQNGGLYRIEIESRDSTLSEALLPCEEGQPIPLIAWPELGRAMGMQDFVISMLDSAGIACGADPSEWTGRFTDLHRKYWRSLQVWNGSSWHVLCPSCCDKLAAVNYADLAAAWEPQRLYAGGCLRPQSVSTGDNSSKRVNL